jgi:hypothetical protein
MSVGHQAVARKPGSLTHATLATKYSAGLRSVGVNFARLMLPHRAASKARCAPLILNLCLLGKASKHHAWPILIQ